MRLNKFLPFALIYFFVNSIGLPFGLTWMTMLGPFFYVWVMLKRKKEILLPFLAVLFPFLLVHLFITGVDLPSYVLSLVNIVFVYFFCQAFYTFLRLPVDHENVLRKILIVNFGFCIAAIVIYFTPYREWFWIRQDITKGVSDFLRLKLLTYEASYYALLFTPVFVFYFLQYTLKQNRIQGTLLMIMLFLPLLLSFSLGVIACLLVAGIMTLLVYFRKLIVKRRVFNFILNVLVISAVCFAIAWVFFRDNTFFHRVTNFFQGEDSSGQGRTADAFVLSSRILENGNEFWGIGPGQLKTVGSDIIRAHYLYYQGERVAIPNAAAETLLLFGWFGLGLRLFLQLFFFFVTKAWTNYFRLTVFVFIFLYQFTGSFITNGAEYVIWILAFTNCFPQFDVSPKAVQPGMPNSSSYASNIFSGT